MGRKILRMFLIIASISYIGTWIYMLFSIKTMTAINPVALTDNLIGIAYSAGISITLLSCIAYQGIYMVIILPILIVASYKGIWTVKPEENTRRIKPNTTTPFY